MEEEGIERKGLKEKKAHKCRGREGRALREWKKKYEIHIFQDFLFFVGIWENGSQAH